MHTTPTRECSSKISVTKRSMVITVPLSEQHLLRTKIKTASEYPPIQLNPHEYDFLVRFKNKINEAPYHQYWDQYKKFSN